MNIEFTEIIDNLNAKINTLELRVKSLENKSKKWTPPTLEEVSSYCKERNKGVDPDQWYNHYLSNGWLVGKVKMKSWEAAVRTWEKLDFNKKESNVFIPNSAPKDSIPKDYGIVSPTAINRTEYLQSK